MANTIRQDDLAPGASWTFVHSSGRRVEYVYDSLLAPRGPNPKKGQTGLDAMHNLLNPETGKCAQVTEKWMREGAVGGGHSYWLVGHEAAQAA